MGRLESQGRSPSRRTTSASRSRLQGRPSGRCPPYEEPNAMTKRPYHYTESGLDSVYLQNGYEIVTSRKGRGVIIEDIDGLHKAIGQDIVGNKKKFRGKEFGFL